MGKGSNASKIARARADAAKRKASEGKGGGGKAGMMARKGGADQEAQIAAAKKEREIRMKLRAEKAAKLKALEDKKARERAKRIAETEGSKATVKSYPPAEFIRSSLEKFYSQNCPEKLGNLDKIMEKFTGKWGKLEAGLRKTYKDKAPDFCKLYAASK
mmetsp:Transcript_5973/g.9905  ORF Transcript_5973/g.9905 Transcript_5973/m.9905 type:complete len:159 (-) Transcript_5973:83-559(-)|eukprot:jgi/Bigna1/90200/estExt_fgenesh1_pg.C_650019